jgi:hypothetical protein
MSDELGTVRVSTPSRSFEQPSTVHLGDSVASVTRDLFRPVAAASYEPFPYHLFILSAVNLDLPTCLGNRVGTPCLHL